MTLPSLLPKRRQRQSTEFLLDPFTSALSDYAAHHTMPQFQHCVVCFSHIYAQELPERRIRDYDNLELKQFLEDSVRFYGCQLVIATHSPFLLSLKDAEIYDLDRVPVSRCRWTELENVRTFYEFFQAHQREFS